MDLPSLVTTRLEDESPLAVVSIGGQDLVVVTPDRTLVYRAEGLLRDESVDTYANDTERLECSVGRRKATLRFHYVDGPREFTVGKGDFDDVLEAVLAGVFVANEVIEPDESIEGVYRFSELALVITDRRIVKHVGAPIWDEDFEHYPFEAVTGFSVEEGNVSTQIVLEVDGRPQRIKAPSDSARQVRHAVETALCSFHDVDSIEGFREVVAAESGDEEKADTDATEPGLEGVDTLIDAGEPESGPSASSEPDASADAVGPDETDTAESDADTSDTETPGTEESDGGAAPSTDGEAKDDSEGGGDRTGGTTDAEVAERLEELEAAVERQNELVEQLVEELRRGR